MIGLSRTCLALGYPGMCLVKECTWGGFCCLRLGLAPDVAQDDLEFKILLSQLPGFWRYGVCHRTWFYVDCL